MSHYHSLLHIHRLPCLSRCQSKIRVVLRQAWSEQSVDSKLMGYLTISVNISCYQTRRSGRFCFSATQRTSAWHAQHSSTAAAQNSRLRAMAPNSPELNSVDYKI